MFASTEGELESCVRILGLHKVICTLALNQKGNHGISFALKKSMCESLKLERKAEILD